MRRRGDEAKRRRSQARRPHLASSPRILASHPRILASSPRLLASSPPRPASSPPRLLASSPPRLIIHIVQHIQQRFGVFVNRGCIAGVIAASSVAIAACKGAVSAGLRATTRRARASKPMVSLSASVASVASASHGSASRASISDRTRAISAGLNRARAALTVMGACLPLPRSTAETFRIP